MTNKKNASPERLLGLFLPLFLVIILFLTAFQKQRWDTDIFWALKSGGWIFENLRVPMADPFSQTFPGKAWIDFTWGFQVIAYLFYTYLGGWYGLFILQFSATILTFVFIYKNSRIFTGGRAWMPVVLLYLVFTASQARFFIRPHIFSYLFVSVYFFVLNLYREKRDLRRLLVLPLLQVLWVNIHSSFVLGILIVASYALGGFFEEAREKGLKADASGGLKTLVLVAFVCPIVSFINPYGWDLVTFPFVHLGGENVEALSYIGEWQKVGLRELVFYFYPIPLNVFAFKVLLYSTALLLAANIKRLRIEDIILFFAAFYLAALYGRFISLFAFFAAPILSSNASRYLEAYPAKEKNWGMIARLLNVFLAAVLIFDFSFVWNRSNYGAGVKEGIYPEGTVSFIKKEGIRGNIYNEYVFGGYLIYNDIPVFIDGRTPTVYPPYFFWETIAAETSSRWQRLQKEHGIDMALVKTKADFCQKLKVLDKEWAPVMFDDVSVLYLKRGAGFDDTISRWEIKSVNPCEKDRQYILPEDKGSLLAIAGELKKVMGYYSSLGMDARFARPHRLMGLASMALGGGHLEEAADELKRASEVDNSPYAFYDLGLALSELKRYDEALLAFKKASPGFNKGYMGMGLAYYGADDYVNAVKYLDKYIDMERENSEQIAYKTLGLACFKSAKFDCAVKNLKKAAFLTDGHKELADIYYNIGNSYLEMESYKAASLHYTKAMEEEPEYKDVLRAFKGNLKKMGKKDEVLEAVPYN